MNQETIMLESSPGFVLVCILVGLGYAALLYKKKSPWGAMRNRLLFGIRAVLAFFLAFLLLGPIVKQVTNQVEKPLFVMLYDNSASVAEAVDSVTRATVQRNVNGMKQALVEKGYDVVSYDLDGSEVNAPEYRATSSDLHGALRNVITHHEGRKLDGVLLVSDGIYNSGLSPLYSSYNFPVHTLGVGDTTERMDISIRNVAFNKIAYQGNRFPIQVEVLLRGLSDQTLMVSLRHKGKVIDSQSKKTGDESLVVFDFSPQADEQGIQRYDIQVEVKPGEYNIHNNRTAVFVEVVEGKKKIVLVAPSPHPDIKALRSVLDKNTNYDFRVHIPGVMAQQPADLDPAKTDLVIFHQAPDRRGKTRDVFQQFAGKGVSMMIILGQQTDLPFLVRQRIPLTVESISREFDDVTPVVNPAFNNFSLEPETRSVFEEFPPVMVPFGKIQAPLDATPLFFQRVGNLATDKPLLTISTQQQQKVAVMLGEGFWRWRLDEFSRTDDTKAFDEVFGKLIQYLSTADDRRRFKSYPVEQEFSESEGVVFESQVYNDIFEPVYGNAIDIELTDEAGKRTQYNYVISLGNTRYQIGGLKEGVYRYRARTTIAGKVEQVSGQFAVVSRLAELQNLTADFDLLRKLSAGTGGKFFAYPTSGALPDEFGKTEATSVIRSEERYDALINLKWIFFVLLAMISTEWFLRKFFGGY